MDLGGVGVLQAVELALDPLTVVPFTDTPRVMAAEELPYEVVATLYFYPGPSAEPAIAQAKADLEAYVSEHYRLGHDIAVSGLFKAAHQNGCQRVVLNITADIIVQPWQAARCTSVKVVMGGRDV